MLIKPTSLGKLACFMLVFFGSALPAIAWGFGGALGQDEIFRDRFRQVTLTVTPGPEVPVNTTTGGNQQRHQVARLGDGGWVVVWQAQGQGVVQRRYDSAGQALGGESQVSTFAGGDPSNPRVAALAGGGWVVAWNSWEQDGDASGVFMRAYFADGTATGEQQVNIVTNLNQQDPAIAGLQGGGFVIYWRSQEADGTPFGNFRLYHRLYDANGTAQGGERPTGANIDGQLGSYSVAALSNGGWVASFSTTGFGSDVFQEAFSATGSVIVSGARVNSFVDNNQFASQVAALEDGGWVVAWESALQDGDGWGIFQQRFNPLAQPVGGERRVNSTTTGNQQNARIVGTRNGGWVVIWTSGDPATPLLFQQAYNSSGDPIGGETRLGGGAIRGSGFHRLNALDQGGWLAVWQDGTSTGTNLSQAVFGADGSAIGPASRVNVFTAGRQTQPEIAPSAEGWVVVWQSEGQDGSGQGVFMRPYRLDRDD